MEKGKIYLLKELREKERKEGKRIPIEWQSTMQGLSEEEIANRILCKTTKLCEERKGLDGCDKK